MHRHTHNTYVCQYVRTWTYTHVCMYVLLCNKCTLLCNIYTLYATYVHLTNRFYHAQVQRMENKLPVFLSKVVADISLKQISLGWEEGGIVQMNLLEHEINSVHSLLGASCDAQPVEDTPSNHLVLSSLSSSTNPAQEEVSPSSHPLTVHQVPLAPWTTAKNTSTYLYCITLHNTVQNVQV